MASVLDEPEMSPSKRLKTLSSPLSSFSKGKETIIDESTVDDSEPNSCGICLMEDGNAIRGWIDSCDHYYCFVCIMEWSKVESRCPMCKRRFTTIRRPPKDGLFLTERLVNVPVRDQVYHCSGNATIGPPNPYLEVQCSVCHGTADESLLLLCDLCDSAYHTYCVGLGATVPEGDWFCQDCTVSRAEHTKSEIDTDCASQTCFKNFHKVPLPGGASVSVSDITLESSITEVQRPPTTDSLRTNQLSSCIAPDRGRSVADNMPEGDSRTPAVASNATALGARTLQRCRNVQDRIRALRENWNSFRSGSLSFCSTLVDSGGSTNQRHNVDTLLHDKVGQPNSRSCWNQQLTTHDDTSSNISQNKNSYNIEKAWKMMDVAKSIEKGRGRASFMQQASKHHSSKVNAPKGKANMNPCILTENCKPPGTTNLKISGSKNHYQYHSLEKVNDLHKSLMFEKRKQTTVTLVRDLKFGEGFPTSSPVYELPSARKAQTSAQIDVCYGNGGKKSQENPLGASLAVVKEHDRSAVGSVQIGSNFTCAPLDASSSDVVKEHDRSAVGSVQIGSNFTCAPLDASSSCKMETPEGKSKTERKSAKSEAKRDGDAKSEIQSLVKLNLKLLSGDKKLEVNAFKEVARLATHSILAACGLEHPKPGVHSFPSSVCFHNKQVQQQLRMSTLMPSSCRECFYVFVKDVVKTIMLEKMGCVQMSR